MLKCCGDTMKSEQSLHSILTLLNEFARKNNLCCDWVGERLWKEKQSSQSHCLLPDKQKDSLCFP